jgi:hypothetical protein
VKISMQSVIAFASLLVSAAGVYFGVALARDLPPFDDPDTPDVDDCPPFETLVVRPLAEDDGTKVAVEWIASGGCEPFSGTLSRAYVDPPSQPEIIPVSGSFGRERDIPPCREGEWELEYVLELRDGVDVLRTGRAKYAIEWESCLPGIKPILTPIFAPVFYRSSPTPRQ